MFKTLIPALALLFVTACAPMQESGAAREQSCPCCEKCECAKTGHCECCKEGQCDCCKDGMCPICMGNAEGISEPKEGEQCKLCFKHGKVKK